MDIKSLIFGTVLKDTLLQIFSSCQFKTKLYFSTNN